MTHSLPRMTILLLALVLLGLARKKRLPRVRLPEVSLADVVQQDVPVYIEAVGETRGSQTVEIRARVSGFLEAMHFTEGGAVRSRASCCIRSIPSLSRRRWREPRPRSRRRRPSSTMPSWRRIGSVR